MNNNTYPSSLSSELPEQSNKIDELNKIIEMEQLNENLNLTSRISRLTTLLQDIESLKKELIKASDLKDKVINYDIADYKSRNKHIINEINYNDVNLKLTKKEKTINSIIINIINFLSKHFEQKSQEYADKFQEYADKFQQYQQDIEEYLKNDVKAEERFKGVKNQLAKAEFKLARREIEPHDLAMKKYRRAKNKYDRDDNEVNNSSIESIINLILEKITEDRSTIQSGKNYGWSWKSFAANTIIQIST